MATPSDRPSRTADVPGRGLPRPVRAFLATEASAAILLLTGALVALLWANSPWGESYRTLWRTEVGLDIGAYRLRGDLHHWVNDGLMTVFFFVVGLEIKRELVAGDLRDPRSAAMPVIGALGGMVLPALLFLAVAGGGDGSRGWGIPMATDIAFAVGVVTLIGPRVSPSLKLFLLTLAIVDDIGAIIVIGLFYSTGIQPELVVAAAALVAVIMLLRRLGVASLAPYLLVGAALWLLTYESGVHATIAGVVLGLLTPARPLEAGQAVSPAERLAHRLRPWSSFVILPVFALANAGVKVTGGAFDAPGSGAVTAGVIIGLVVGKTLGISAAAWLGVRTGVAILPHGATWTSIIAMAAVAGIGFTVSLFIAELAFAAEPLREAAKLGVLAGSTVAAVVGGAALRWACRPR